MNSNRPHSSLSSPFPSCSAADTARHARTPSKITTPGGVPAIHLGMLPKDSPLYNSTMRSRGRTQLYACSKSGTPGDCGPRHLSTTPLPGNNGAASLPPHNSLTAAALHVRPEMPPGAPMAACVPDVGSNDATRLWSGSCTPRKKSPEKNCTAAVQSVDSALPVISWEIVGRKQSATLDREAAYATPTTRAQVAAGDGSAADLALSSCPQNAPASSCECHVEQSSASGGCTPCSPASPGQSSALCPAAPSAEPGTAFHAAPDPSAGAGCCLLTATAAAPEVCVAAALPQPCDLAAAAPTALYTGSADVDCAAAASAASNSAVPFYAVSNPADSDSAFSDDAVSNPANSAAGERGASQLDAALERQHVLQTALTAAEKRAVLLQQQKRRLLEQVSRMQKQAAAAASGDASASADTCGSANGDRTVGDAGGDRTVGAVARAAAHVAVQTDAPSTLGPLLAELEARARLLSAELNERSHEHEALSQRCALAEATAREAVVLCEAVIQSTSRLVDGTPQQQSPRPPSSANAAMGTPAEAWAHALCADAATPRQSRPPFATPGAGRSLTGSCSSLEGASRDELVAYGRARFRQLREKRSASLMSPACSFSSRTADVLGAS